MKRIAVFAVALLFFILLVAVIRTLLNTPVIMESGRINSASFSAIGPENRLAQSIQFRTISFQDEMSSSDEAFRLFHEFLQRNYPLVHSTLILEKPAGNSLLFKWTGTDTSLKPVLLLSHQDVVPADDSTDWSNPPFSGIIDKGFVWGRGALDDKCGVIGILEAVETLLQNDHKPVRSIYLAFGHDEETGGEYGAGKIAEQFKRENIFFESILDEGGLISDGIVPGVKSPFALVAIAEKGYMTVKLEAIGPAGHSSLPGKNSAIATLSEAILKLEKNPFPARYEGVTESFFESAAPFMSFGLRLLFSNPWLFRRLILHEIEKKPSSNASVRTTMATTVVKGGNKENVIPSKAEALINIRMMPGHNSKEVLEYIHRTIADTNVTISVHGNPREASVISDIKSDSFSKLAKIIRSDFANIPVAPFLMPGGTDARHYAALSENIYRFIPVRMKNEDLARIHGKDERVSVENFNAAVKFYIDYILNQ